MSRILLHSSSIIKTLSLLPAFRRLFATQPIDTNYAEKLPKRETLRANYLRPPTTFYHNYKHTKWPMKINFVTQVLLSTKDTLYFYFPEQIAKPFIQVPVEDLEVQVDDFYKRNIHVVSKRMVNLIDDCIYNTTSVDSSDPRVVAHNLIQYVVLSEADNLFEKLLLKDKDCADLGVKLMEAMIEGINYTHIEPREIVGGRCDQDHVKEANIYRLLWWDVAKMAESMWNGPQYRSWARCLTHHLKYYINFELVIVRHRESIDMFSYLFSRLVTVGMGSLTPYLLNQECNLDVNFQHDDFFTKLAYFHAALVNDIISFPKELDDFTLVSKQTSQRFVSYVKVLMDQGMSSDEAILKCVADANQVMVKLNSFYEDENFISSRDIIYTHIRSTMLVTNFMIRWTRYGWRKIC